MHDKMTIWPQCAVLAILCINLFVHLVKDRREATTIDAAAGVIASFLLFGAWVYLLWAGGFWMPIWH